MTYLGCHLYSQILWSFNYLANNVQNVFAYVSQVLFFPREFVVAPQNLEMPGQVIQCCFTPEVQDTREYWGPLHYAEHLLSFNLASEENPSLLLRLTQLAQELMPHS